MPGAGTSAAVFLQLHGSLADGPRARLHNDGEVWTVLRVARPLAMPHKRKNMPTEWQTFTRSLPPKRRAAPTASGRPSPPATARADGGGRLDNLRRGAAK